MPIPDPVSTSVAIGVSVAAANQAAKQVQDFIAAVAGHKGESIGAILGDFAQRRWKNVEKVAEKSHFILLDIGQSPREVSLPIIQPTLEYASLQEDEYLQDTWANLLANAADPRQLNPVLTVFPELLKGLTSREVKFLQVLFMAGPQSGGGFKGSIQAFHHQYRTSKMPPNEIPHYQGPPNLSADESAEFDLMMDLLLQFRVLKESPGNVEGPYGFTALGRQFVRACQRPHRS